MLIDTHTHIAGQEFDEDREAVIARALAAGVDRMILVGVDLPSSERGVALAEKHPYLWATVGLHPHEAGQLDDTMLAALDRLAGHPKVVAIGETGLDYYYNHSSKADQHRAFAAQIGLAKRRRLPLVIHSREAWKELFEMVHLENLAEHIQTVGAVLHCFTGNRMVAEQAIGLGFFISFSGIVTFPKSKDLQEAARSVDLSRTLIETDAPYLAPQGVRGQRNEPAHVRKVAEYLAQLHGSSLADLAQITSKNAERLFGRI
jgi:TatD DNase family protein